MKTLNNSTASQAKDNVADIEFWGKGDQWELICKASSKAEGWMKSTKAMEIQGLGCLVQVTTQQGDNIAEAVTFVPHAVIGRTNGLDGSVIERRLKGQDEILTEDFERFLRRYDEDKPEAV